MQGKKTYQEKLFFNYRLPDHVPADNLCRRLNDTINFDFIYKSTANYYGKEEQGSIDPVVFIKLIPAGNWKTSIVTGGSAIVWHLLMMSHDFYVL